MARRLTIGLNARFSDSPSSPFLWSIVDAAAGHWIVLTYRHVVSDGRNLVRLLAQVMTDYLGDNRDGSPVSHWQEGAGRAATAKSGGRLRGFVHSTRLAQRVKGSFLMPEESGGDREVHVVTCQTSPEISAKLSERCKSLGVGVTDAVLAALASAIAGTEAYQNAKGATRRLALASVATDRDSPVAEDVICSEVRLYSVLVVLKDPAASFDVLLREVESQTRWHKRHPQAAASASSLRTRWSRRVWPLMGIPNAVSSYRRYFPICAGVSPMRVEAERFGSVADSIGRYVRAIPTGPAMPIALAPTTFRDQIDLSLTAMNVCLRPAQSSELLTAVIDRLSVFAAGSVRGCP